MPRQPRIDSPDLLHHIIVRGVARSTIFRDDEDRQNFVDRLQSLLNETDTECFAWALIPNHFHLLLRPRRVELSRFMRRLLTGYAVTFNRRHNRSGHLFQNRYKSIVCEEDAYLLELVRYVHLNPLRAKQVVDLTALDRYPWCGHAEILNRGRNNIVTVDTVLSFFAPRKKAALEKYHQYMIDGLKMGKRPELMGGGLRRSSALATNTNEYQDYDERVLGSGDFVSQLRNSGILDPIPKTTVSLEGLNAVIADHFDLSGEALLRRSRQGKGSAARALFCYCAVRMFGHSGAAVGSYLKIGSSSISRAVQRGEQFVEKDAEAKRWLELLLRH